MTTWAADQRRRHLARTIEDQRLCAHREGTLAKSGFGYLRLECSGAAGCGATIALYAWRRRAARWELDLTWHIDGSI